MKTETLVNRESKSQSFYLLESTAGIYLPENHAKMVWQGNKNLIVKPVNFKGGVGRQFYLIGGNECYGVVKLKSCKQIDLKEFNDLSNKHRITGKEYKDWWRGKKVLYAYEFDIVKKFDVPKRVSAAKALKGFAGEVKFLSEKKIPSFISNFKDAVIIKDFLSVVGSSVEGKEKPNDIDLLIRLSNPSDFVKRAIETRISKMADWDKGLHYIWGDSEGPHDCFVPVYDLVLVKREPKLVEMASSSVEPLQAFKPMKPGKAFYELDETLDYLFGGK